MFGQKIEVLSLISSSEKIIFCLVPKNCVRIRTFSTIFPTFSRKCLYLTVITANHMFQRGSIISRNSRYYLGKAYLPSLTIGGPIRAPKWPNIHPKNTIFPSIFSFVANIRYSTLKMTPITISLLQPISNLSGNGISTILNHRGPHQSPKMTTRTPHKTPFPLAPSISWLISGTPH